MKCRLCKGDGYIEETLTRNFFVHNEGDSIYCPQPPLQVGQPM